ncbi:site-specific integrase [Paraburkholderia sprentiae WSM5005]|uniref:Site-specific integrase n=1 Tax=Paraburkholderia sprentiae WSM5005 TaxID=754502 RepID=A0A1I9YQM9_9BURK|nr:site-specific integrase [Paraburkholderia sprentiae]APA88519.1 site-specific integrase [Paraburkholderia sprentiae WSM5005]
MAKQRINRELIRRLESERAATIANGGAPKLRDIYDDQLTGFGLRMRPNGSTSFVYRWSSPAGQQKKALGRWPAMTVEEARAAVRAFTATTDHKADTPAARVAKHQKRVADAKHCAMPTVGQYLDGDYRTYWLGTTKSETPEQSLRNIRRDFPDLMSKRIDEVSRPMVKKWIEARIAAGHKPSGINRTLGALGGLFSHAVGHEIVTASPCARLRCKVDPEEDEHGRELTAGEEARLRAALDARETRIRAEAAARHDGRKLAEVPGEHHAYVDHVKPAIIVAINTGLRRSELLRARWTAVDWKAKTFTVEASTSKVKRSRVIPLNAEALATLKAWRDQTFRRFEFIFTNEIGEPLREVRDWDAVKQAAQIEGFRFMDCRHHMATRLINEGASPYHVQKILGHRDGRMTQRYLKARETKLAEALALLDRPRTTGIVDDSAQAA